MEPSQSRAICVDVVSQNSPKRAAPLSRLNVDREVSAPKTSIPESAVITIG